MTEFRVTPWDVEGDIDYKKLIEQFGTQPITDGLIERVEAMPDTVVTLTTGRKILVREPPEEVVEKTVAYLRGLRGSDGDAEAVINIAQAGRVIK